MNLIEFRIVWMTMLLFQCLAGGCNIEQFPNVPPHNESRMDLRMDMG